MLDRAQFFHRGAQIDRIGLALGNDERPGSDDEIVVEEEAHVIWARQDPVIIPGGKSFSGFGHYVERRLVEDSNWKLARLMLTRLHMDSPASPTGLNDLRKGDRGDIDDRS